MILSNQKEYEDAMKSLSALLELTEEQQDEFDGDIEELVKAVLDYEKLNYPIQDPPGWAVLEFHIYDRLGATIKQLPINDEDKIRIAECIYEKCDAPEDLLEKVKSFKLNDLQPV